MPLAFNPTSGKFDYISPDLTLNALRVRGGGGTSYSGYPAALAIETDSNLYWQLVVKDNTATTDHFGIVGFTDGSFGFQSELYATTGTSVTFGSRYFAHESSARGTGAITGKTMSIGRNTSGSGAAGALSLFNRNGSAYYIWPDATGALRIGTSQPTEDNSVSDTSGVTILQSLAPTMTGPVTINEVVGSSGLTITGATQTASVPALNITQTWNNAGVTFGGIIKANVTDTASNAASLLMDLQVGSVSKFSVAKTGQIVAGATIAISGGGNFTGDIAILSNTKSLTFGSGQDVTITRDAANVLAQRNSTNAQTFNIYETYTDASNYSRLALKAQAGSYYQLIPQAAGTGTLRGLQLAGSSGLLGFYGATPIAQPTTAGAAATRVAGAGASVLVDDTYDGYTLAQVVKALRTVGLLA